MAVELAAYTRLGRRDSPKKSGRALSALATVRVPRVGIAADGGEAGQNGAEGISGAGFRGNKGAGGEARLPDTFKRLAVYF